MNKISPYWEAAQKVSAGAGVPAEWIYAQWAHESADFSSSLATQDNNFGGIKYCGYDGQPKTDTGGYQHFKDLDQYAEYFIKHLNNSDGVKSCQTPEQYVQCMKDNDYFEDSVEKYTEGVVSRLNGEHVVNPGAAGYTAGSASGSAAAKITGLDSERFLFV